MNKIITKRGNHVIEKLNEFEFKINVDNSKKMNVPVTIYADDSLILKMSEDRTLDQAVNVSTLPGVRKHVVVLPDGHEGYGFPVGGVAATDMEEGVISPGGVGYDINCGVRLGSAPIPFASFNASVKKTLLDAIFRNIPSGTGQGSRPCRCC